MNVFLAIDIETADSKNSAPCEIGLAFVEDRAVKWAKSYLINPETTFSPFAMRVHKITPDVVKDAPTLKDIWQELIEHFTVPLVMHNAAYDISVLRKAAEKHNLTVPRFEYYCTLETAKHYYKLDGYKLSKLCSYFGVVNEKEHSAKHDAAACAKIALSMLQDGRDLLSCPIKSTRQKKAVQTKREPANIVFADFDLSDYLQSIQSDILRLSNKYNNNGIEIAFAGLEFESKNDIKNVILYYETAIYLNVDAPYYYERLAVLYRRHKLYNDELRVICHGIKNVSENSKGAEKLRKRLIKVRELIKND